MHLILFSRTVRLVSPQTCENRTKKEFYKVSEIPREVEVFCLLKTLQQCFTGHSSRSLVSESWGSLSNMSSLRFSSDSLNQNFWGWSPEICIFDKFPWGKFKLENHCLKKELGRHWGSTDWSSLRNRKGDLSSTPTVQAAVWSFQKISLISPVFILVNNHILAPTSKTVSTSPCVCWSLSSQLLW